MKLADDVNIEELALRTEGYTGADIEAVCREAAMEAIREGARPVKVAARHFEKALKNVPPSVSQDDLKYYMEVYNQFRKSSRQPEKKPVGIYMWKYSISFYLEVIKRIL